MKFNNYLNENKTIADDIIEKLKRDCMPIISVLKKGSTPLYRCTSDDVDSILLKNTRKDRKPLSSSKKFHNYCNNTLFKKFGWKPRSEGVFVWASDYTGVYGLRYLFFPIGDYKFIWSKEVGDLYNIGYSITQDDLTEHFIHNNFIGIFTEHMWHRLQSVYQNKIPKKLIGKNNKFVLDYLLDNYKDKDFAAAIKSQHEIMFKCEQYYLVNTIYEQEIREKLFK